LQAVGELLALGEQEGLGVTFKPDTEGWTIGYTRDADGGELLTGSDLGETARAAVRPLLDIAQGGAAVPRQDSPAGADAESDSRDRDNVTS
jgi:hypothetical protein